MKYGHIRVNYSLPRQDHMQIKSLCERRGVYLKDFMHALAMKEVEKDKKRRINELQNV